MATHWHYPDVLPLRDFTSLVEESTLELQKAHNFLIRITEQPMLLFKEAHIYLKSNRNIVTAVMTTSYLKDDKVNGHAFQVFLASILDKALQSWVKKNDIPHDVRVLVRNPNSFPSIFAVYVNEQEVVQFNIFDKWYGVREQILSEKELKERAEKNKASIQNQIEETEKKMENWKKVQEKPISLVRSPRDVYILLFKRKNVKVNVDKKVTSLQRQKEELLKEMERAEEHIPEQIDYYQIKQEYIDCILPFFKELSYSLKEEKYNLY